MNDKVFYQQVADEIGNGQLDRGVWAKAFAEANGDETLTRARYLKARVAELQAAERKRKRASRPSVKEWMLARWVWVTLVVCALGYSSLQQAIKANAVEFLATGLEALYRYEFIAIDGKTHIVESSTPLTTEQLTKHVIEINRQLQTLGATNAQPWYLVCAARLAYITGVTIGLLIIPVILALIFRGRWRPRVAFFALLGVGACSTYGVAIDHWGPRRSATFAEWLIGLTAVAILACFTAVSDSSFHWDDRSTGTIISSRD
ncbi:MAG: hypothetical protein JO117_11005 [Verrucomicrobia bacterium]|nr:hypothetical protein [Verrucomicrobiota bacterium]